MKTEPKTVNGAAGLLPRCTALTSAPIAKANSSTTIDIKVSPLAIPEPRREISFGDPLSTIAADRKFIADNQNADIDSMSVALGLALGSAA